MIKLAKIQKAARGIPARYLVMRNGRNIGLLEKYTNTSTETYPWKAFAGIGLQAEYLGPYYPEHGGKKTAILAILTVNHKANL